MNRFKIGLLSAFGVIGFLLVVLVVKFGNVGGLTVFGLDKNKINQAQQLGSSASDYNLLRKAELSKQISDCKQITDSDAKKQCIISVASSISDEEMCIVIEDKNLADVCIASIQLKKIIATGKPGDCNKLANSFAKTCVDSFSVNFKKDDECDVFKDSSKCKSLVAHTNAINSRDLKGCDKIIDVDLKAHCQAVISSMPIDSDTDGLSDNQEMSIGTDPFVKDTDGDGASDGQEINASHTNPKDATSK